MRGQRYMSQVKKQNKRLKKELNSMETSNLLDADFKTLVIRMLNELRERVDELHENFNTEIGNITMELQSIKMSQSEMKNTLTAMKISLPVNDINWESTIEWMKQRIRSEI